MYVQHDEVKWMEMVNVFFLLNRRTKLSKLCSEILTSNSDKNYCEI